MFVASPFLTDFEFRRSVIYVVDVDDTLVQAVTMNRPSTMTVSDAVSHEFVPWDMDLFIGGIEDWETVLYLHTSNIYGSQHIAGNIRVGGDLSELYDNVQIYGRQSLAELKFFAGHIRMMTDEFMWMWRNKLWVQSPVTDPFGLYYWDEALSSCGPSYHAMSIVGYEPN